jgi:methylmalonyl-CoA/ethylmalonyl-CoA epimerase
MIKRIHHIAVVVEDIVGALGFWQDALGLQVEHQAEVTEQQARVAFLPVGEGEVELVQPTNDTSGMAKYLAKRGPGIHHICVEVDDITGLLAQLKGKGVRLIDETARSRSDGTKYAFIHPESTKGVLVELYELPSQ